MEEELCDDLEDVMESMGSRGGGNKKETLKEKLKGIKIEEKYDGSRGASQGHEKLVQGFLD